MSETPKQPEKNTPDDAENLPSNLGHVVEQLIERELHESYLTYAMSTIMDRALPDVRDGLKPSQRKVLYAAFKKNLKNELKAKAESDAEEIDYEETNEEDDDELRLEFRASAGNMSLWVDFLRQY